MVETIRWRNSRLELIDQTLLPAGKRYIACRTVKDVHDAIRDMKVRGAPAIGVAAAYGVYLGARESRASVMSGFKKDISRTVEYMAGARPTARNLFWALERMSGLVERNGGVPVARIKKMLLEEAHAVLREDERICRAIGRHGKGLLRAGSRVLTHCNAGGLATSGYGTALGVIFSAKKKIRMVYAGETRPVLQGARLTVWELVTGGVPVTLICDNMAASLMARGKVDAVVVGADRIAANGDTANKIGTYGLAVLAGYHGIPFYVAAPLSTFDTSIKNGSGIVIEERSPGEVRRIGGRNITVKDVDVWNPAFDVTPSRLITAIITEKGVIRKPDRKKIKRTAGEGPS